MDFEVFTIAGLAFLTAGGWLVDLINHSEESRFSRHIARQIKKSADVIHNVMR
jgi:hypothetical protein